MARSAIAYLIKPVNEQLLLEQVNTVLSREGRILIVEVDQDTTEPGRARSIRAPKQVRRQG
jgi:hypothetical protein